LRIGLDLDNTIANYDNAFLVVANSLGHRTVASTKRTLKEELAHLPDGESLWQRIQGLVYGRFISEAKPHAGALEFVRRALVLGHDLYIVSHKTQFGHFDDTKTPLREAASRWLTDMNVVGDNKLRIAPSRVIYTDTREQKIASLNHLKLDVFIDDLLEVLLEPSFPSATRRIWVADAATATGRSLSNASRIGPSIEHFASWHEIGSVLFGDIQTGEVAAIITDEWPEVQPLQVHTVAGRGNSRIFQVRLPDSVAALKMYPSTAHDPRPRRITEWRALASLEARGLPVPVPVATSETLNWSLIEWVDGDQPPPNDEESLQSAAQFVRSLEMLSRSTTFGDDLATEACLRPSDIAEQIDQRMERLRSVNDSALEVFLESTLGRERDSRISTAQNLLGAQWSSPLARALQVLSPSDFGFHNAIRTTSRRIVFIDFEYFGWDDPVKLVADFVLHPGSTLSKDSQQWWIREMSRVFASDANFTRRLSACLPLYALRWSLIMLNEFLSDKSRNRLHARGNLEVDLSQLRAAQLEKARQMIRREMPYVPQGGQ